jgi:hypothetical protein
VSGVVELLFVIELGNVVVEVETGVDEVEGDVGNVVVVEGGMVGGGVEGGVVGGGVEGGMVGGTEVETGVDEVEGGVEEGGGGGGRGNSKISTTFEYPPILLF